MEEGKGRVCSGSSSSSSSSAIDNNGNEEDQTELRRGPWTEEEDLILMNYISVHGEGRWNQLASRAGLRRTGKSCRLRWMNYLRPDVRRGNITVEEQLLILHLHAQWGNRWSKIAQHLPGRTDNEIKNYWRTRVQKQARRLKCDVNSLQFHDALRRFWVPRLLERLHADAAESPAAVNPSALPYAAAEDSHDAGASSSDTLPPGVAALPELADSKSFPLAGVTFPDYCVQVPHMEAVGGDPFPESLVGSGGYLGGRLGFGGGGPEQSGQWAWDAGPENWGDGEDWWPFQ